MKKAFNTFLLAFLILSSTQVFAQFDIDVTPAGLVTVKYLGCDPCNPAIESCLEVVKCKEECKVGFDFEQAGEIEMDCWYDCYYDHPPGTYDCDNYCRKEGFGVYDDCVSKCGSSPAERTAVGFVYRISWDRAPIGVDPAANGIVFIPGPTLTSTSNEFTFQIPGVPPLSNYCIQLEIVIFYGDGKPCGGISRKCFIFG